MPLNLVSHGIDSLYLSYRGVVAQQLLDRLEELKQEARAKSEAVPVSFEDRTPTVVQPMGWQFYRYWVHCSDFDLFVSPGDHVPPVYVRLSSFQLHSLGAEAAIAAVTRFINDCVMDLRKPPMPSRVDLYADFQGWLPEADDLNRFVTRSVKSHLYYEPTEEAHSGLRLTGFRFGRDQLVARLYDKTLEIATSGKDWMREVWRDKRPGEAVWRLEFQFRREVIDEFHLNSADELLPCLQDLWRYGLAWLSLREPSFDRQRRHWPLAEEWRELGRLEFRPQLAGVLRQRLRDQQEVAILRGLVGYLTSYAAIRSVTELQPVAGLVVRAAEDYLDAQGRDFRRIVAEKRLRLV